MRRTGVQETLTERALELLALPQDGVPKLLLDLGCGSGLSGESLTKQGHTWVVCALHCMLPVTAPCRTVHKCDCILSAHTAIAFCAARISKDLPCS